jgi:NAD(P)-dependent dehydrogenase (short-subunit alcohol dehydrogenase family)
MTRTALITGSSRNIGRALAVTLAENGYDIVLNARSGDALEAVADEIRRCGQRALACPADVRDQAAVADMIARAERELGGVDVLVNNAVLRAHAPVEDLSLEEWQLTIDVVLTGAFLCSQAALPGMRRRRWGRIVNMAGVAGQKGAPNRAGVASAKAGLIGLTKALAHEVAAEGVTVNAISPGMIDTDRRRMTDANPLAAEHYERETADTPVGRMGSTDEVAAACLYLCSDGGSYVTGQTLSVNGGLYM